MTSMDNTPDSPAKTPEGYTTQGGNFWTLITPETWKVLHAVLHNEQRYFAVTEQPVFILGDDSGCWMSVRIGDFRLSGQIM